MQSQHQLTQIKLVSCCRRCFFGQFHFPYSESVFPNDSGPLLQLSKKGAKRWSEWCARPSRVGIRVIKTQSTDSNVFVSPSPLLMLD